MKKIVIMLASVLCVACSSTYVNQYDWDAESGEYIKETGEYLGEFSYTGFTYAWRDFTEYQITEKVRKSAMRKYGRNITLRNFEIEESRALPVIATSAVAVAGITMIGIGAKDKTVIENGVERTEADINALGGAGVGVLLASPVFAIFFKKYKITASVFRNDANMYRPARLAMTEMDKFNQVSALRRANYDAKKRKEAEEQKRLEKLENDRRQKEEAERLRVERLEEEQRKKEAEERLRIERLEEERKQKEEAEKRREEERRQRIADRIARHEVWIGMTKEQLIQSLGEPTRAVIKEDGITSDSVGIGTSYGRASSATTRSNRVQVYCYPNMEIYIKSNTVTEIYDLKN